MNEENEYLEEIEEEENPKEESKRKDTKNKNKTKKIKKTKTKTKKTKDRVKRKPRKEIVYKEKKHPFFTLFLILIILALLGVIGYLYYENYYKKDDSVPETKNLINEENEPNKSTLTESEALSLGNELYNDVYNLYIGKGNFNIDSENQIECDSGIGCFLITNYEEVTNKLFTENGRKDFERNAPSIKKEENNVYFIDGFALNLISYLKTTLEVSKITENKITFKAISSYCDLESEEGNCTKESKTETKKFVIEKVNNIWLVSEFSYPVKE